MSLDVIQPGATTRKGAFQVERQNSDTSYYAYDEDVRRKYRRRGELHHKIDCKVLLLLQETFEIARTWKKGDTCLILSYNDIRSILP